MPLTVPTKKNKKPQTANKPGPFHIAWQGKNSKRPLRIVMADLATYAEAEAAAVRLVKDHPGGAITIMKETAEVRAGAPRITRQPSSNH